MTQGRADGAMLLLVPSTSPLSGKSGQPPIRPAGSGRVTDDEVTGLTGEAYAQRIVRKGRPRHRIAGRE